MLPDGSRMICVIYSRVFPALDLFRTDPAEHAMTTDITSTVGDLDRDLSNVRSPNVFCC